MLEAVTLAPITDDWYDLRDQTAPIHSALLGTPFSGVLNEPNTSFTVHTSYVFSSCTLDVQFVTDDGYIWNVSGPGAGSGPRTYGRLNATGPRLRVTNPAHQRNDTSPRLIGLQSRSFDLPPVFKTQAWCNLTTTYIELQVQCSGGPQNCAATSVRRAPSQARPATATTLDCIWANQSCQAAYLADAFFRQL